MQASASISVSSSSALPILSSKAAVSRIRLGGHSKSGCTDTRYGNNLIENRRLSARIAAIDDISGLTDPGRVEVTWQIAVGAIAGVTPFAVAGVEFSKRIIAQRKCGECGGSGLVVVKNNDYVRCPECGGFLPWQSWKRFFTG